MTYMQKQRQIKHEAKITRLLMGFVWGCVTIFMVVVVSGYIFTLNALESEITANNGIVINVTRKEVKEWQTAPSSAYNVGDPAQTDASPCTGASGDNLCDLVARGVSVCAFNQVPLRTALFISGIGECIVLDRTSEKYSDRIDLAFPLDKKQEALNWGVQEVKYQVDGVYEKDENGEFRIIN